MKFGLFVCQTNTACRGFCFALCKFEKENKLRVYKNAKYVKKKKKRELLTNISLGDLEPPAPLSLAKTTF